MAKNVERDPDFIWSRQTRREAATDRWYLWVIAVVGLVLAAYFYTHPGIWTMDAEMFYVAIFGSASVLAALAGMYRVYSRPTRYLLP